MSNKTAEQLVKDFVANEEEKEAERERNPGGGKKSQSYYSQLVQTEAAIKEEMKEYVNDER